VFSKCGAVTPVCLTSGDTQVLKFQYLGDLFGENLKVVRMILCSCRTRQ